MNTDQRRLAAKMPGANGKEDEGMSVAYNVSTREDNMLGHAHIVTREGVCSEQHTEDGACGGFVVIDIDVRDFDGDEIVDFSLSLEYEEATALAEQLLKATDAPRFGAAE